MSSRYKMRKRGNEDFAKAKHKVGRKKVDEKSTNVNVRTKRIRVQEQSIMKPESDMVNYRNKSLADLVGQFSHFSASVRKEALLGLRDLFSQNDSLYATSVNILITNSIKLLLDTDNGVRQALITVYSFLLPNIPSNQLCPFSDVLCVFINNGLTSLSPGIRRSSLLMVQTLLSIEPSLFRNSAVKLLISMVKLASETKTSLLPTRGVMSSNRTQQIISKEQRSITELALETVQQLFLHCLSTSTIYSEINQWSGTLSNHSEFTSSFHFPLHLTIYPPSLFFHTIDSTSTSDPSLIAAVQSLLTALYPVIAELVPEEEPTPHTLLHTVQNPSKIRTKSIPEKDLRKLLLLEELAGNALLVLERAKVDSLEGKSHKEWRALLMDLYPLRLPDAHRNETQVRLVLQQVNELTVLLLVMMSGDDDDVHLLVNHLLKQNMVLTGNGGDGGDVRMETVQLRVELLHRLYERSDAKGEVVESAERMWKQLIEKKAALCSLPFIQFFQFVANCHDVEKFDGCLENVIQVLSSVRYSAEEQSIGFKIWNHGLKLMLQVVKLSGSVSGSFKELFQQQIVQGSVVSLLTLNLQAIIQALVFYCGNAEISKAVTQN